MRIWTNLDEAEVLTVEIHPENEHDQAILSEVDSLSLTTQGRPLTILKLKSSSPLV